MSNGSEPSGERRTILLIGSGPIQIGQAAEFDYSGAQACRALQEEGVRVVLVNSNPATIMTDPEMADAVYIEPITTEAIAGIVRAEEPDGVIAGLGGQTGLNVTAELAEAGVLSEHDVEILGTPLETIYATEDRDRFRRRMTELGEPVPESTTLSLEDGESVTEIDADGLRDRIEAAVEAVGGLPVIARTTYTLGGSGSGIVHDVDTLSSRVRKGLRLSRNNEVLLTESIEGWVELEYEVMRDADDSCVIVCNMENLDPMGVHTGESTVVTPSQVVPDRGHQQMRNVALEVIRDLGIHGGCNIQFAWRDDGSPGGEYRVVEVNPRVSRSSALASKATGYPIARVTAKVALGKRLHEMMAIGSTFEESLLKALRSSEYDPGIDWAGVDDTRLVSTYLERPSPDRPYALFEAFDRGFTVDRVADATGIERWYLERFQRVSEAVSRAEEGAFTPAAVAGLTNRAIADIDGTVPVDTVEETVPGRRYKQVDTCAGEFAAETPYYYSARQPARHVDSGGAGTELRVAEGVESVVVVGGGPIRIGQGVEFDYCSVHAVQALRELGIEAYVVNNNPETVSTDYDTSDGLFFEPLSAEEVTDVIEATAADGVMVQFGGQTSVNIGEPLQAELDRRGLDCEILGTTVEAMDLAEDRDRFNGLMADLGVAQPEGGTADSEAAAMELAHEIGYPVLVRPSYVLGGRAMRVVHDDAELARYIDGATRVSPDRPVLVDEFLQDAVELDVDAVADGETVLLGGILEHVERAGVHSGDSACVIPPRSLAPGTLTRVREVTETVAAALDTVGLLNVQLAVHGNEVYVLEANPRSSRTVPFVSKATGVPIAKLAAKVMAGESLETLDATEQIPEQISVKEVVLPFDRLPGADPRLTPEMKSTGEVMGTADSFGRAYRKAQHATGKPVPTSGTMALDLSAGVFPDPETEDGTALVEGFSEFFAFSDAVDLVGAARGGELDLIVSRDRELLEVAVAEEITYFSTPASAQAALTALRASDEPLDPRPVSDRRRRTERWGE